MLRSPVALGYTLAFAYSIDSFTAFDTLHSDPTMGKRVSHITQYPLGKFKVLMKLHTAVVGYSGIKSHRHLLVAAF